MDVIEVSPEGLARLLLAALCHGLLMAVLTALRDTLLGLGEILREETVAGAMHLRLRFSNRVGTDAKVPLKRGVPDGLSDFFLCLVSSALLISLNFIFNNGKFRLFTVTASFLAFLCTELTVGGLLRRALILLICVCKRVAAVVAFPFRKLFIWLAHLLRLAAGKVRGRIRVARIKQNTAREMSRLRYVREDGLIKTEMAHRN